MAAKLVLTDELKELATLVRKNLWGRKHGINDNDSAAISRVLCPVTGYKTRKYLPLDMAYKALDTLQYVKDEPKNEMLKDLVLKLECTLISEIVNQCLKR